MPTIPLVSSCLFERRISEFLDSEIRDPRSKSLEPHPAPESLDPEISDSRSKSLESHPVLRVPQLSSQVLVPLQFGYFRQLQNVLPAFFPFRAITFRIGEPHLGQFGPSD